MNNELKIAEHEEPINKDRKPTAGDKIILKWLEAGNSINNLQAIQQFKNAMLRDACWRLKKAGYPIQSEWVRYETSTGQKKKYKRYFLKEPEVIQAGVRVEKSNNSPQKAANAPNSNDKALLQPTLF